MADPFSLRQLLPPQCQSGPMVLVDRPEQLLTLLQQHVYDQHGKKVEWRITNRIYDIIQEWRDAPQNIYFVFCLPKKQFGQNKLYIRKWPYLAQADPISPPPITTRSYLSTACIVFFVSLGKWSGCVTCRCLYGRFQNRHRSISQSFIKELEEGNAEPEPCFCWLVLILNFAALYLVSSDWCVLKWISYLASCWITSLMRHNHCTMPA